MIQENVFSSGTNMKQLLMKIEPLDHHFYGVIISYRYRMYLVASV